MTNTNKIKPFVKRLIKENIFYIVGNVFLFLLIIIVFYIGFTENAAYNKKNTILKSENAVLINKINLINNVVPKSEILDEDIKFLNSLIPNTEDYFSIIYALEKLSQKTKFSIVSYSVNVATSTSQKLRISVTGIGDSQSFVDFLKDYNFSGGRLITSDKVSLDPNFSGSIIVDLTFYNKKTPLTSDQSDITPNSSVYKELEALKSKVNFSFEQNQIAVTPDLNYPRKENPF